MSWAHDALIVSGHIHEQLVEIDILLIVGANQVMKSMARDGEHREAVAFSVVKTIK